jgi:hypothetical protein
MYVSCFFCGVKCVRWLIRKGKYELIGEVHGWTLLQRYTPYVTPEIIFRSTDRLYGSDSVSGSIT